MRSRAERRVVGEWLLRAALVLALAFALWRAWQSPAVAAGARAVKGSELARELPRLIGASNVSGIDVSMDAMPGPSARALLVALRRAGTPVRWSGSPPPLAIEISPLRDPAGGARIVVAGGSSVPLALVDSAGPLDSLRATQGGRHDATVEFAALVGAVRVVQGPYAASAPSGASPQRRAVLVLGRLGWESRFVILALVEAGWAVRARIPLAPGAEVRDEGILPIDTARYDVVVALDSTAADFAPAIARFVGQGGGLVAGAGTLALADFRALAPGRAGERQPGRILLADDSVTPADLPVRVLTALRDDALALERTRAGVTLAARRAGLGRVISVGYDESWRWRMLGGGAGASAHRAWWFRTVGSAAPERPFVSVAGAGDAAPLASLVASLGPASARPARGPSPIGERLPIFLLLSIAAALVVETASRRFRGAR